MLCGCSTSADQLVCLPRRLYLALDITLVLNHLIIALTSLPVSCLAKLVRITKQSIISCDDCHGGCTQTNSSLYEL